MKPFDVGKTQTVPFHTNSSETVPSSMMNQTALLEACDCLDGVAVFLPFAVSHTGLLLFVPKGLPPFVVPIMFHPIR